MGKGHPDTAKNDPDDIHQGVQAACAIRGVGDYGTKRYQSGNGNLEQLEAEWNANDGEAQDQSTEEVFEENEEPSKNKPDDIA